MVDPPKRVVINEAVCEGCGDCGRASNCLSVVPVETEFGRKRQIDQSTCNKDFSCVEGFCPSFVTVHGGRLRKRKATEIGVAAETLPEPALPAVDTPYGILVTGVGGTGVVTIGALIGMAAHIEGKGCSVLDMTGLAQKGGSVFSHVRIAKEPEDIHAVRIAAGGARLLLGCDVVVAASFDALAKIERGKAHAIVNTHQAVTGDFTRQPDLEFPVERLEQAVLDAAGPEATDFLDATRIATALMGDSIATNLFMLGYAYQKGLIPVSGDAITQAIELNGVAVESNKRAFLWGRRAGLDLAAVEATARRAAPEPASHDIATDLDEIVARRRSQLTAYQDAALAERYRALVEKVRRVEAERAKGRRGLAEAVARNYFKLLAYKDEYEVARLYANGDFRRQLEEQFEGDYRIEFNLAPPIAAARDPKTGHLKKRTFGPWMMRAFGLLAKMKGLRGTALDPFGRTEERKLERRLITDYERVVEQLLARLDDGNHALAVEIAGIPDAIRGYGHVKLGFLAAAKQKESELLAAFHSPGATRTAAE
jgi:indolepyruvate ferredoxin oxidoreductase